MKYLSILTQWFKKRKKISFIEEYTLITFIAHYIQKLYYIKYENKKKR